MLTADAAAAAGQRRRCVAVACRASELFDRRVDDECAVHLCHPDSGHRPGEGRLGEGERCRGGADGERVWWVDAYQAAAVVCRQLQAAAGELAGGH